MTESHRWTFFRAGGVDQVVLASGDDLVHLDELDQTLWVALSMPVRGVDLDPATLDLLDTDHDGRVRQPEVVAAIRWVRDVYADPGQLLRGGDEVPLAALADGPVRAEARRVLTSLGKPDAKAIALADVTARAAAIAKTWVDGDGVVQPDAAEGDVRAALEDVIATHGQATGRAGKTGVDRARADAFFAEVRAHVAWAGRAGDDARPLGDATPAAADAVRAVRAKVDDYFTRCRLAGFDERAAVQLGTTEAALAALAGRELAPEAPEVAALPLARIDAGRPLPLDAGVNPAWAARIAALAERAVVPLLGPRPTLTEDDWAALLERLAPYERHLAERPIGAAGTLPAARLEALAAGDAEAAIGRLLDEDAAVEPEVAGLADLEKLCRLQRDLLRLLRNYVSFAELYRDRDAVFQAGTLYLDSRAASLVVEVTDAGKHASLAPLAGAYLTYCDATRGGEKKAIAAAFTDGSSDNLIVGRNGVFYDRAGRDWDATVTKIVDNPISIRQAFWAPYKKLARLIEQQVAKRASAADTAAQTRLASAAQAAAHADQTPGAEPPKKIDVGTVAAIGVAIGGIGAFVTAILTAFLGLGWWMPIGLAVLALMISGPSMLLAFLKLRTRNLGPLLDANGWAINGRARINVPFGRALTRLAVLPRGARRSGSDPYAERRRPWKLYVVVVVLLILGVEWYLGKLDVYLPRQVTSERVMGDAAPVVKARKRAAAVTGAPKPDAPKPGAPKPGAPTPTP